MNFLSLFAGVGGLDLGFQNAGAKIVAHAEVDAHASAVYRRHFPRSVNLGDVRDVGRTTIAALGADRWPDIIAGGFPCQDVSLAGKRAGLAGERSGLWFEFARIIGEIRSEWVVIENVKGLLSSNRGRDFGLIIQTLSEFGYGVAWRVLDSQHFGVPQQRKRVFIVGHFRGGGAAKILFESKGGPGHSAPRKGPGQEIAHALTTSTARYDGNQTLIVETHAVDVRNLTTRRELSGTLAAKNSGGYSLNYTNPVLTFTERTRNGERQVEWQQEMSYSLNAPGKGGRSQERQIVHMGRVRRLTPVECERLQGFPDNWTAFGVDENGDRVDMTDSRRVNMLGKAVTVNVAEWLARQIKD